MRDKSAHTVRAGCRGHAPDVTLGERHRVIGALHAAKFLGVDLVVLGIHQERQRHLEGVVHLAFVDRQLEAGLDPRHRRQDAKPERGYVEIEIADRLDEVARRARSPPPPRAARHRAARHRSRRSCRRETRSGRRGCQMRRALGQQHGRLAVSTTGISTAAGRTGCSARRSPAFGRCPRRRSAE